MLPFEVFVAASTEEDEEEEWVLLNATTFQSVVVTHQQSVIHVRIQQLELNQFPIYLKAVHLTHMTMRFTIAFTDGANPHRIWVEPVLSQDSFVRLRSWFRTRVVFVTVRVTPLHCLIYENKLTVLAQMNIERISCQKSLLFKEKSGHFAIVDGTKTVRLICLQEQVLAAFKTSLMTVATRYAESLCCGVSRFTSSQRGNNNNNNNTARAILTRTAAQRGHFSSIRNFLPWWRSAARKQDISSSSTPEQWFESGAAQVNSCTRDLFRPLPLANGNNSSNSAAVGGDGLLGTASYSIITEFGYLYDIPSSHHGDADRPHHTSFPPPPPLSHHRIQSSTGDWATPSPSLCSPTIQNPTTTPVNSNQCSRFEILSL
jgi:hypothetical protein